MKHDDHVLLDFHLTVEEFDATSLQGIFQELFGKNSGTPSRVRGIDDLSSKVARSMFDAIRREAEPLVKAVNESIQIAQDSTVINTRRSEIATARAKIIELQRMMVRHPSLQMDHLEEAVLLIAQIDQETVALQYRDDGKSDEDGRRQEKRGKVAEAVNACEGFVRTVSESNKKQLARLKNRLRKIRQRDDSPS